MTDQWIEPRSPFTVATPPDQDGWDVFVGLWGGAEADTLALQSIVRTARASGARSVVIENHYPDLDQQSESEYWSRQFALPHTDVYRLHFFAAKVTDLFPIQKQEEYLGYAVVARPVGRLVRALLRPPPCMAVEPVGDQRRGHRSATCEHCSRAMDAEGVMEGRITAASETVELFGIDYEITGIPYCGQEAWHLQCGHATAWTCLFTAYLRGWAPRTTLRDAVEAGSSAEADFQRAVSATGTNLFQMQHIFTRRGMPALVYETNDIGSDDRLKLENVRPANSLAKTHRAILGIVCNYLNSGFPVVAVNNKHTITLIGWRRIGGPGGELELLYSDDDEIFGSLTADEVRAQNWKFLMIPLPPDVVLSGEAAQAAAYNALENLEAYVNDQVDGMLTPSIQSTVARVISLLRGGKLSLRLQLKSRHEYRAAVHNAQASRGANVARTLSALHVPNWVWVAEFQDRKARESGDDCVVAEFVFDTTSPDDAPHAASFSLGPVTFCNWPYDHRAMPTSVVTTRGEVNISEDARWESQINTGPAETMLLFSTAESSRSSDRLEDVDEYRRRAH